MPVLQGHELWVGHNEAPLGMIFWSPLPLLYRHQIESFLSIYAYATIVNLFIFLVYIMLLFIRCRALAARRPANKVTFAIISSPSPKAT